MRLRRHIHSEGGIANVLDTIAVFFDLADQLEQGLLYFFRGEPWLPKVLVAAPTCLAKDLHDHRPLGHLTKQAVVKENSNLGRWPASGTGTTPEAEKKSRQEIAQSCCFIVIPKSF